jgi:23S rRNA pseudouridine1911/1915/1917 synthase
MTLALRDVAQDVGPASAAQVGDYTCVEIEILYEDELLLVANKPAGMVVHPAYKNPGSTLMDALAGHGWRADERPSIVGRLDTLTSGVVVVAKTAAAHAALQRALQTPDAEKIYLAVVYGYLDPACVSIDLRIRADPDDRRRRVASRDEGAASRTIVERLTAVAAAPVGLSLVRCRLLTGRRHQIRVHLAAAGWPIVGDAVYGPPRSADISDRPLAGVLEAFPRQALHASRVAFTHPATRDRVSVTAPLPADFANLLAATGLRESHGTFVLPD